MYLSFYFQSFPAQALAAWFPEYRHSAFVVVRQEAESHKSEVMACSSVARLKGIRPGMLVRDAEKRCRGLKVVYRQEGVEARVKEQMERVFETYTPEYKLTRGGGALLNLTGTPVLRSCSAREAAVNIRCDLQKSVYLPQAAMGLSHSRLIGGMLARMAAPTGVRLLESEREDEWLSLMDPQKLPGLSSACRDKLKLYGLRRVEQVRKLDKHALLLHFGKEGEKLYCLARALDWNTEPTRAEPVREELMLHQDIVDEGALRRKVRLLMDKFCFQLKKRGASVDRYTLRLVYTDHRSTQKTVRLGVCTNSFASMAQAAQKAFGELNTRRVALKVLCAEAAQLREESRQLDLFDGLRELKQGAIGQALVKIRIKQGFSEVLSASNIEKEENVNRLIVQ